VVILGIGAIVIDIGALYQERRELQNGADAAALAVARECAANAGSCAGQATAETTADNYGDANSYDLNSGVQEVCGSADAGISVCAGPGVALYGYKPPDAPEGAKWVRVTIQTRNASGSSNEIAYRLAQVLGVVESGKTVRASATAAWGPLAAATTIPLTFSLCEYEYALQGSPPQSGPPFSGDPAYIYFHGTEEAAYTPCPPAGVSGFDLAGGFGWLDNEDCIAEIDAESWVGDKTGVAVPSDCDPSTWRDATVLLPIYDATNGLTGTNGEYHISGFVGFHITGYLFSGYRWPSGFQCPLGNGSSSRCIRGYFTTYTGTGTIGGGQNYGALAVDIIG
jgi:Flp pilus assembly protein TadG